MLRCRCNIARKKQNDEFDVLLIEDMSRFTRSGSGHGAKLEYDLNAAGIDAIGFAHDLVTGQIMIDKETPMPYLRFAFETFRLTHLHQLLAHALKMIQMIPLFRG